MDAAERTGRFLELTPDYAVIHASLDGVIEAWGGAAERVLGFSAAEAVGMSLSAFFTEADRQRGLDLHEVAVARTQGRSEDDRWHLRRDGSAFWASGVLTRIDAPDGTPLGLCKVLRDKTDVRTQLESFENQLQALRDTLAAERRAVATVAHELRNPLMPMISALGLLQRPDAAHMTDRATKVLTNQVGVLKRLVDDLAAVSLDATALPTIAVVPVNLNGTLADLVDGLLDASNAKGLRLSLVLPPTDIQVPADPARFQQMLLNLLNNALKYTPSGGHIDVSATVEADMAVVRIEDDGLGIAADVLPRIFELFTREGRQTEIEGHGVGLAIVKQLASAHGGFVEARSPGPGKGSIFTLRIPVLR